MTKLMWLEQGNAPNSILTSVMVSLVKGKGKKARDHGKLI